MLKNTVLRRGALVGPVVAAAALALVACGPTTGSPSPAGGQTTSATGQSGGASPSGSTTAADPLSSVDPCSLLTPDKVTSNQLAAEGPSTIDGARACKWQKHAGLDNAGFTIGVRLYEHDGLDQLKTSSSGGSNEVSTTSVGQHQAIEIKYNGGQADGSCAVAMGISSSSAVYVNADDGGGNQTNACEDATEMAQLVEPHIPAGTN